MVGITDVCDIWQEKVYYTKETQTAPAPDDMDDGVSGRAQDDHVSAAVEESIRQKILNEQERERLKQEEAALKSQEEQLEREIEQGLRELTSDELNVIYGASEFVDFVEQSSKIVERALTDSYDFMKDYTSTMDRLDDQSEGRQIKMHRVFWDETLCKGRSITDLDWSTKVRMLDKQECGHALTKSLAPCSILSLRSLATVAATLYHLTIRMVWSWCGTCICPTDQNSSFTLRCVQRST